MLLPLPPCFYRIFYRQPVEDVVLSRFMVDSAAPVVV